MELMYVQIKTMNFAQVISAIEFFPVSILFPFGAIQFIGIRIRHQRVADNVSIANNNIESITKTTFIDYSSEGHGNST